MSSPKCFCISHLYSSFLAIVHRLTRGCDEFLLTLKDYAVFSTLLIYISCKTCLCTIFVLEERSGRRRVVQYVY